MTSRPDGEDSSLAAMIAALRRIAEAQAEGATWAQIGAAAVPAMSGREAKKAAHRLREAVKEELLARAGKTAVNGDRPE